MGTARLAFLPVGRVKRVAVVAVHQSRTAGLLESALHELSALTGAPIA